MSPGMGELDDFACTQFTHAGKAPCAPSLPFPVSARRKRDLGLFPADLSRR